MLVTHEHSKLYLGTHYTHKLMFDNKHGKILPVHWVEVEAPTGKAADLDNLLLLIEWLCEDL